MAVVKPSSPDHVPAGLRCQGSPVCIGLIIPSPAPPQHLPSCCYRLPLQHFHRDVTGVDLYTPPANTSNVEQVGQMTKYIIWTEKNIWL